MATGAEPVDRFVEHKEILCGMRVMTNDTTPAKDNSVNIGNRFFFVEQVLFIIVTGKTKLKGTVGPELIPVFTSMGVMAQGAAAD